MRVLMNGNERYIESKVMMPLMETYGVDVEVASI
jgi:hypothetical protein